MSILGYSSSYFLPEYWANTPLYGERIIPLLDYMLSMDYEKSEGLARAYYNITSKYKNEADLPTDVASEIIDENGYSYVRDLLGNDEEAIRLLLLLMVLVHQLKGTKLGIQVVLNLLRRDNSITVMRFEGTPRVDADKNASGFSTRDYVVFSDFSTQGSTEVKLKFGGTEPGIGQCIVSVANKRLRVSVNPSGQLTLSVGSGKGVWDICESVTSSRAILPKTDYYMKLMYDGYEFSLQLSPDGVNYDTWVSVEYGEGWGITTETLYLGVDFSGEAPVSPFSGYINFSDFSVSADNIEIEQWFEQTPVGEENTFIIKSDLDITLISTEFFANFSNFVKHYVYPTLQAFIAGLSFQTRLTVIPFARTKIRYIAFNDLNVTTPFVDSNDEDFLVLFDYDEHEPYEVRDANPIRNRVASVLDIKGVRLNEDLDVIG